MCPPLHHSEKEGRAFGQPIVLTCVGAIGDRARCPALPGGATPSTTLEHRVPWWPRHGSPKVNHSAHLIQVRVSLDACDGEAAEPPGISAGGPAWAMRVCTGAAAHPRTAHGREGNCPRPLNRVWPRKDSPKLHRSTSASVTECATCRGASSRVRSTRTNWQALRKSRGFCDRGGAATNRIRGGGARCLDGPRATIKAGSRACRTSGLAAWRVAPRARK